MKTARSFFEECQEDWRDGYLIPVRNRMGNMLERDFLPKELKEQYIEKFGEEVIYDDDFTEWYCSKTKR